MRERVFVGSLISLILCACSSGDVGVKSITEDAVRKSLKDPDSAQFSDVYVRQGPGATPDTVQSYVCGYVNAKNSYGGYVGRKRFIGFRTKNLKTGDIGNDASLAIEDAVGNFTEKDWFKHCEFGNLPKV